MEKFIETFTGRRIYPLQPDTKAIDIADIAHALALQCRYTGHCTNFYSVAEHSVRVGLVCRTLANHKQDLAEAYGLFHDASEAYLCDIASPVKQQPEFEGYREAEARLTQAIFEKVGLPWPMPRLVKEADLTLLMTEKRDLMPKSSKWPFPQKPLRGMRIVPLAPPQAEAYFLSTYRRLQKAGVVK